MVSTTKFELQLTFMTKIPLVDLDKSHAIIVANKGVLDERKYQ
jgi:hypothetical protein